MKVRKRLIILGTGSEKRLKPRLFFMAGEMGVAGWGFTSGKMGLSGWIINMSTGVLEAEFQGDERRIQKYIDRITEEYNLNMDDIRCEMVDMDEADDGSLRIG